MKKDDSIAFQEDKTIWRGPEAIIKILIHMDGGYKILGKAFKFIPKFLIRYGYKIVANNRYKIFGKKESCDITNSINPKYIIQHEAN
jgi:predicted DCC family thiol-disulfide oxidoreductase YuxK